MSEDTQHGVAIKRERTVLSWIAFAILLSAFAWLLKSYAGGGPDLALGYNVMNAVMMVAWAAFLTAIVYWWKTSQEDQA